MTILTALIESVLETSVFWSARRMALSSALISDSFIGISLPLLKLVSLVSEVILTV